MKRIEFVLPVESMRGNLSGEQTLVYAQNNNPAYEAPNGTQYARNYQGRYIGSKVSRSGLKYFAVKTKSATVLNTDTRLVMGTLAGVAAIRSALMKNHAQDYAQIVANLAVQAAQGIISGTGKRTIMSLFYEKVSAMLQGKQLSCTFSGSTTVTIQNPWISLAGTGSVINVEISSAVYVKYAPLFWSDDNVQGGAHITIAGLPYFVPNQSATPGALEMPEWINVANPAYTNANYVSLWSHLAIEDDTAKIDGTAIKYNGTAVDKTDDVIAGAKYTL